MDATLLAYNGRGLLLAGWLRLRGVHLKVTLQSGEAAIVEVPEGRSLKDDLEDLLGHKGRFEGNWVEVKTQGKLSRHVRYDQIVEVVAKL